MVKHKGRGCCRNNLKPTLTVYLDDDIWLVYEKRVGGAEIELDPITELPPRIRLAFRDGESRGIGQYRVWADFIQTRTSLGVSAQCEKYLYFHQYPPLYPDIAFTLPVVSLEASCAKRTMELRPGWPDCGLAGMITKVKKLRLEVENKGWREGNMYKDLRDRIGPGKHRNAVSAETLKRTQDKEKAPPEDLHNNPS
ncbi:hypothetical protein BDR04DRAFT_1112741 [Suillus decipiens]|nr:hypothetical protein BDR04DRAFT_1112741 [Suillus decipiens]